MCRSAYRLASMNSSRTVIAVDSGQRPQMRDVVGELRSGRSTHRRCAADSRGRSADRPRSSSGRSWLLSRSSRARAMVGHAHDASERPRPTGLCVPHRLQQLFRGYSPRRQPSGTYSSLTVFGGPSRGQSGKIHAVERRIQLSTVDAAIASSREGRPAALVCDWGAGDGQVVAAGGGRLLGQSTSRCCGPSALPFSASSMHSRRCNSLASRSTSPSGGGALAVPLAAQRTRALIDERLAEGPLLVMIDDAAVG